MRGPSAGGRGPGPAEGRHRGPAGEWVSPRNRLSPGKKEWQPLKAGQETVLAFFSKASCRYSSAQVCVHTGKSASEFALGNAPWGKPLKPGAGLATEEGAGTLTSQDLPSWVPLHVCLRPPDLFGLRRLAILDIFASKMSVPV